MNPLQVAAMAALVAAFKSHRNLDVEAQVVPNNSVITVSGYVINLASVCFIVGTPATETAPFATLPDFPPIEVKKTGRFALPTIRSYRESNQPNSYEAYPKGVTAFDAALFADSHVRKQNGAWLRRSPQAATAVIASAVSNAPSSEQVLIDALVAKGFNKEHAKVRAESLLAKFEAEILEHGGKCDCEQCAEPVVTGGIITVTEDSPVIEKIQAADEILANAGFDKNGGKKGGKR